MFKKIRSLVLLVTTVAVSAPASAQLFDKRFYVAPAFSASITDGDRLSDNGLGAQLSIGRKVTKGMAFELSAFYSRFEGEFDGPTLNDTGEFKGIGLATNIFAIRARPNLYARLAVFYGRTSDAPCQIQPGFADCKANYDSVVLDVGAGYLLQPAFLQRIREGMAIRLEALYRADFHQEGDAGRGTGDNEFYDAVFNVGLHIPIGSFISEEPETEPVQVVEPEPEPVLDSDNDGVNDDADQCPATPAGAAVNEAGCSLSQCRPPFPGESADGRGCVDATVVVLRGVTFDFDSARITPTAEGILDQVADVLIAHPGLVVEVGGHTDDRGAASYNQRLSQQRAEAVRDYLVDRGVDSTQLETAGYGESEPLDDNSTEAGRENNRRVELKILATND